MVIHSHPCFSLFNFIITNKNDLQTILELRKYMENEEYSIPWVEKYRPTKFDDIVLDPLNQELFEKIITKEYFPHLLFYGPPGTGKTTTIINLIQEYQKKHSRINKENIIHLNASDERGIDIIRNQIFSFVRSKNLFEKGFKFVILDEVDYMTKNAQHALKYLLQTTYNNVRFCLICNYISKIDVSLKSEFLTVRFNQLPEKDIFHFIKQIAQNEHIDLHDNNILEIQKKYCSDIRSMINYLQLNKDGLQRKTEHGNQNPEKLHTMFLENQNAQSIAHYIHQCTIESNNDKINIIQLYLNYLVRNHSHLINEKFFTMIENLLHNKDVPLNDKINYFIHSHLHFFHA